MEKEQFAGLFSGGHTSYSEAKLSYLPLSVLLGREPRFIGSSIPSFWLSLVQNNAGINDFPFLTNVL